MSLTSPQRRLVEDFSTDTTTTLAAPNKWKAQSQGKHVEIKGGALTPDDLRQLASALEHQGVTEVRAVVEYNKGL